MTKAAPKQPKATTVVEDLIDELTEKLAEREQEISTLEEKAKWYVDQLRIKEEQITSSNKRNEMFQAEMRGMERAFGMFMNSGPMYAPEKRWGY
jgi:uncharacterized coiled-coil protein SlyX